MLYCHTLELVQLSGNTSYLLLTALQHTTAMAGPTYGYLSAKAGAVKRNCCHTSHLSHGIIAALHYQVTIDCSFVHCCRHILHAYVNDKRPDCHLPGRPGLTLVAVARCIRCSHANNARDRCMPPTLTDCQTVTHTPCCGNVLTKTRLLHMQASCNADTHETASNCGAGMQLPVRCC